MPLPKVLIVDDDPGVRRLLELASRRAGLEPILAPDGAAALKAWLESAPQAIVLDWEMPVMDGRTFLRTLRDSGSRTPVIVISARSHLDGCSEPSERIVPKPFDPTALVDLVRALCARPLPAAAAG